MVLLIALYPLVTQVLIGTLTLAQLPRCDKLSLSLFGTGAVGIYQAEVRHLSHAYILLIMRLLAVVIPNITFKFGANNFTFIRVRLGQVWLGYVNLNVICPTNEHHTCNQHLK